MYGPPGTGKTPMARVCAACFLNIVGPSLVQMFIGDGAKLARDASEQAKEKAPAIIVIDELDAIETKRFDSGKSGDRKVHRTMPERLDGKIEFPLPNESARARILEIHSRKVALKDDVNFEELARSTNEFNVAQLKAVC